LLISLETGMVRYCVRKNVLSDHRLRAQRGFLTGQPNPSLRATYFGDPRQIYFEDVGRDVAVEPLALLHRSYADEEVG
jgi:hypothetical protein